MANLNKVMLIGNLTRDPELRHTPKGTAVAELSLAINRSWRDDAGTKQEETTFVEVTLWGRTAEVAHQYLTKGLPVYIEGRLSLDTWDDKETGKKRTKMKIVGEALQLLHSKPRDGSGSLAEREAREAPRNNNIPANRQPAAAASSAPTDDFQEDDDLPF